MSFVRPRSLATVLPIRTQHWLLVTSKREDRYFVSFKGTGTSALSSLSWYIVAHRVSLNLCKQFKFSIKLLPRDFADFTLWTRRENYTFCFCGLTFYQKFNKAIIAINPIYSSDVAWIRDVRENCWSSGYMQQW